MCLVGAIAAGCSLFSPPRRHAQREPTVVAEQPAPSIIEEEIVGPPEPELVGPPLPTREQEIEADGTRPLPATDDRVAAAGDRVLLAALARLGVSVHPSSRGVVVRLADSVFEYGGDKIERDTRKQLREVARVIREHAEDRRIMVEGHSDSTGAALYNQGLSERRAVAVAAELVSAGLRARDVRAVGQGSLYPIAPNENADGSDNAEGRARNRRVEIIIEAPGLPRG